MEPIFLSILIKSSVISILSVFLTILLDKWGLWSYLQYNGSDLVKKLAHCDFCKTFWIAVIICLSIWGGQLWMSEFGSETIMSFDIDGIDFIAEKAHDIDHVWLIIPFFVPSISRIML